MQVQAPFKREYQKLNKNKNNIFYDFQINYSNRYN